MARRQCGKWWISSLSDQPQDNRTNVTSSCYTGVKAKTGWLGLRIICLSGVTQRLLSVSSTNKTDRQDIFLNVVLNTITLTLYQKNLKLWNRHQFSFEKKHAIICHICIKCLVNTQHVVKITGVTSGAGIKNPYGAYECIHGFNRDCTVPFVVSCVVFCRSLFVLFLKTYSEDKLY